MKLIFLSLLILLSIKAYAQQTTAPVGVPTVPTLNGPIQGVALPSGIVAFKGIPYAQPPVGNLRWREPQPLKPYEGVYKADHFGPQAMQRPIFSDMMFRSDGKSEDCLYLNIWTPANTTAAKLPVLVYFYGGGFVAGDGSEYRYDGEALAKRGIIVITVNYRLGVFGFMAHPLLTNESNHSSSGNYGLMDQHAALVWVKKNIASFGGNPDMVTIGGESAGAMSVCAQMASPLSKGLFNGAIAESGALFGNLAPTTLPLAQEIGKEFIAKHGQFTLSDMRKIPADSLLKWSADVRFPLSIDTYFLRSQPLAIFTGGHQMDVPLLAGWNSAEQDYKSLLGNAAPTVENYKAAVEQRFGADRTADLLSLYPATTDADVPQAATSLASDMFISYASWKFTDVQSHTLTNPVYRYLYSRKRPPVAGAPAGTVNNALGASHSSEIEYALGNLPTNKVYGWTADDYKVSEMMQRYFANFVKTGNPNAYGLPDWLPIQTTPPQVLVIDANTRMEPEQDAKRYQVLDELFVKWKKKYINVSN